MSTVVGKYSAQPYEYKDSELLIEVPSYLRPKKGIRYFSARAKKGKEEPLLHFAIEFLNDDGVKVYLPLLMRLVPGDTEEWGGLEGRILRQGKTSYTADGFEVLSSSYNKVNGKIHYGLNVLFVVESRRIYATFFGHGEVSAFDDACRAVVNSVRIVSTS